MENQTVPLGVPELQSLPVLEHQTLQVRQLHREPVTGSQKAQGLVMSRTSHPKQEPILQMKRKELDLAIQTNLRQPVQEHQNRFEREHRTYSEPEHQKVRDPVPEHQSRLARVLQMELRRVPQTYLH
jgi:hypothetical protein